jgi:glycopeptide antibiotics resistance protein
MWSRRKAGSSAGLYAQSAAHGGARALPLWSWWILIVLAISLPWTGFTPRPQWDRVHWVPFSDPADKPRDFVANIALFVPFGFSLAGRRGGVWRLAGVVLAAAAVSVTAEATQLFSTVRHPSATDVSAAVSGACAGAVWRFRQTRRA